MATSDTDYFHHDCSYCDRDATHIGARRDGDAYCPDHLTRAPGLTNLLPGTACHACGREPQRAHELQRDHTPQGWTLLCARDYGCYWA